VKSDVLSYFACSELQSQDQALAGAGDTPGSDEPAVYWGADAEESDKTVVEEKPAAEKPSTELPPIIRRKRQDMGDSADSRFVFVA